MTAEGVRHACQRRPNLVLLNDFDDIVDWVQIQASDWLVDRHLVAQVKLGNRFAVFFFIVFWVFFRTSGRSAETAGTARLTGRRWTLTEREFF